MIRAGFISSSPSWDWLRQFPDSVPEWDGVRFDFSGNTEACDVIFVYDGLPTKVITAAAGYRVFVASEPRAIKAYDPRFLSQFDMVLTTDERTIHKAPLLMQVGLPWHVGAWNAQGQLRAKAMSFKELESFRPDKTKQVSIVSSNKSYSAGHRERLAFVQRIKEYFGDEVDVFGRGINGFADKLDVLAAYRYHIAIENSIFDHYWTEKLSDPLLTLTYPIYHGCSNITTYFPPDSLTRIDISDLESAIVSIKRVIESDIAERSLQALEEARHRVLYEHNLFAILAKLAKSLMSEEANKVNSTGRTILSERNYTSSRQGKLSNSILKRVQALWSLFQGGRA